MDATARKLAGLFNKNFETYAAGASAEVKSRSAESITTLAWSMGAIAVMHSPKMHTRGSSASRGDDRD